MVLSLNLYIFSDVVYWTEMRYEEGGRYVVCSKEGEASILEWTPKEFNARTTVHEYGGGATFIYDGAVYFSNFADQRIYKQTSSTSDPVPITPAECGWRYADGEIAPHVSVFIRIDYRKIRLFVGQNLFT